MTRMSAEARSAAQYRAGDKYPEPPEYLHDTVKVMWNEIITSKPIDWWEPGSLYLLERYVVTIIKLRAAEVALDMVGNIQEGLHVTQVSAEFLVVEKLTRTLALLADKLRLSVQTSYELRNGRLGEKTVPEDNNIVQSLLGRGLKPLSDNNDFRLAS